MAISGRLTAVQLQQYREDGFVILPDFFSAAEMDALCDHIDVFDEANNRRIQAEGSDFVQVADQIIFTNGINFLDPHVQAFTAQQKFVDLTTQVLGPDVRLYWDQSVYKRPEAKRDFPWHQDAMESTVPRKTP
jgi:phytanoyl-CoA hydroxylase